MIYLGLASIVLIALGFTFNALERKIVTAGKESEERIHDRITSLEQRISELSAHVENLNRVSSGGSYHP